MAGFGHFIDGKEYVIKKTELARPMLNYIWNARMLSGVNHFGGGVGAYGGRSLAYIDPEGKGRASILRDGNRYFYIKDRESGEVFNPGWYPTKKKVEDFSCVHGLGYSVIGCKYRELRAEVRVFANQTEPVEIWKIAVANESDRLRNISVYSLADFLLEGYQRYSDYNSYVHGEYDSSTHSIVCYNGAMEKPHEWFNGFMAANIAPVAFETSRRAFFGTYGSIFEPEAIQKEQLSNSLAACEQMAGVFQHDFVLEAGETAEYYVVIGAVDSMDTAKSIAENIFAPGKIEQDFQDLLSSKSQISTDIYVETPDEKINCFANYWLKQQVQLCAEVGRDTGKGFRDQLQDAWAVASFNPTLAKEKILETLTYMYQDGRCVRGWLPLDHHIYSDGPTWIAPTVNAYIKETGDAAFLHHPVKYLDEGEDTVWEHILTAVRFASDDIGEHGLVHSRDGDWNDSLNMTGLQGKGESVWTSIALYYALQNTIEIAECILKDSAIVDEMVERAARIRQAVNDNGWDGEWFLAAINDYNEKVGSHTETEGKIYLNSQTWAILSDICDEERKEKCLHAIDNYLDSDYGPLTLYPTYTKFNNRIGRLTSFIPGIWENGTPYCHGGTFKVVSDCILGRGNEAYETILKILPDSKQNPSECSGCEPYVVTNMYFGPDNPRKGETMFAWVTGTAGWMFRAITQYMCGFHPSYESFSLKPCLPDTWKEIKFSRKFRGDTYEVHITCENGNHAGEIKATRDGNVIDINHIRLCGDGGKHRIDVVIS